MNDRNRIFRSGKRENIERKWAKLAKDKAKNKTKARSTRKSGRGSRAEQLSFEGSLPVKLAFGGSLLTSHPKSARPLDSKLPIHLVLRANRGCLRLPKFFGQVRATIDRTLSKHGVCLYEQANVGNHLHLLIKIPHRRRWAAFIRELTGRIAQAGLEHVNLGEDEGFWQSRPFTRVVTGWRKAFRVAKEYVRLNHLESEGMISRKETKTLKDLRAIWSG